jgi:gamma-glutamylcyclotransferase (GGCT)/AIG2-like uncharacterized protein YtfP
MKDYLFVYGTLATGAPTEIADTVSQFKCAGDGFVFGRLYDLGEYPGAVLDETTNDKVFGKVLEVTAGATLLERVDAYEQFDPRNPGESLFVRKRATIHRDDGPPLTGWVYEYNRDVNSAIVIRDGRYAKISA